MKLSAVLRQLLISSLIALGVWPALGAVVLDQSYSPAPSNVFGSLSASDLRFERAQTFTVGVGGILHHVDINVAARLTPDSARVLRTTNGLPDGTVLATTTKITKTEDGWMSLDFSTSSVSASAGTVLGIEAFGGTGGWQGNTPATYARGSDTVRNPIYLGIPDWVSNDQWDFWFRTFMDPGITPTLTTSWGRIKSLYR